MIRLYVHRFLHLHSFYLLRPSGEKDIMWPPGRARIDADRLSQERGRRPRSKPVRFAGTVVVAAAMLALGFLHDPSHIVRAGARPQTGPKDLAVATDDSSGPIAASRASLNKLQDDILGLGALLLGRLDPAIGPGNAINQSIMAKSAEAHFGNSKLTREIAEIAIVEYEEGIFKQDQSTLEGEVKLAETEAARSANWIEIAQLRLAMITQASKGTAEDLALEFLYEDDVTRKHLHEARSRLALEQAQFKLDVLRKYARPKRVKELKSEVETARLDELAKQAIWEREKAKLTQLQEVTKAKDREIHEQRVLTLLNRTISIAEQLETKLVQAENDREPGEQLRKEIADSADQLETLVEQAQAEAAAAKWAKLKPKVHAAAVRYLGAQAK
jgi:hypothetical protein